MGNYSFPSRLAIDNLFKLITNNDFGHNNVLTNCYVALVSVEDNHSLHTKIIKKITVCTCLSIKQANCTVSITMTWFL